MSLTTYLFRLEKLDQLIRLKSTGSPEELAHKLGISKRMIFDYIDEMKALGAPIKYDKNLRSYTYVKTGAFNVRFQQAKF